MEHRDYTKSFYPNYSMNLDTNYTSGRAYCPCQHRTDAHLHNGCCRSSTGPMSVPLYPGDGMTATETVSTLLAYQMPVDLRARLEQCSQGPSDRINLPVDLNGSRVNYDYEQSLKRTMKDTDSVKVEPSSYPPENDSTMASYNSTREWANPRKHQLQHGPTSNIHEALSTTKEEHNSEKQLRRLRNNEASRRSRCEKKLRFIETVRHVDEFKLTNRKLREFLVYLDSIIEEAKAILLTKRPIEGDPYLDRLSEDFCGGGNSDACDTDVSPK